MKSIRSIALSQNLIESVPLCLEKIDGCHVSLHENPIPPEGIELPWYFNQYKGIE